METPSAPANPFVTNHALLDRAELQSRRCITAIVLDDAARDGTKISQLTRGLLRRYAAGELDIDTRAFLEDFLRRRRQASLSRSGQ